MPSATVHLLRHGEVPVGLADDVFQLIAGQKPPAISQPFELRLIAPLQLFQLGKRAAQGGQFVLRLPQRRIRTDPKRCREEPVLQGAGRGQHGLALTAADEMPHLAFKRRRQHVPGGTDIDALRRPPLLNPEKTESALMLGQFWRPALRVGKTDEFGQPILDGVTLQPAARPGKLCLGPRQKRFRQSVVHRVGTPPRLPAVRCRHRA